jgi:hypothetical protein
MVDKGVLWGVHARKADEARNPVRVALPFPLALRDAWRDVAHGRLRAATVIVSMAALLIVPAIRRASGVPYGTAGARSCDGQRCGMRGATIYSVRRADQRATCCWPFVADYICIRWFFSAKVCRRPGLLSVVGPGDYRQ